METKTNTSQLDIEKAFHEWNSNGGQLKPLKLLRNRPDIQEQLDQQIQAVNTVSGLLRLTFFDQQITEQLSSATKELDKVKDNIKTLLGGNYKLVMVLGSGGFAHVFLAQQLKPTLRQVAIKVICNQLRERIEREAKAMQKIQSPYVVKIYDDPIIFNHLSFLIMEFVEGGSLEQYILRADRHVDKEKVAEWMIQVARGMHEAEKLQITHRDLKPSNILIDKLGNAKIADFGIAIGNSTSLATSYQGVAGTYAFMAPEQFRKSSAVDTRADIYSYGATFYYVLKGEPPGLASFIKAPDVRSPLLNDIFEILQKCLKRNPRERYQSFEEIINALNKLPASKQPTKVASIRSPVSQNARTKKSKLTDSLPPLWVYKCNAKSEAAGDWKKHVFNKNSKVISWGHVHDDIKEGSIQSHASRKLVLEQMQVGDLVLAWQSDRKQAIGLCRVYDLNVKGKVTRIVLEKVFKFAHPVNLLEYKNSEPVLMNCSAFKQGAGSIFETTPDEAKKILEICGIDWRDVC
ncbi:MAG: protein kinase [Pirellulales bacterium]|nr:protein kinase [Pirellulales bacterium]